MMAGQAPSPAEIAAAAQEADAVLARAPASAPPSASAAADQKTMMAGQAPSPAEIAAAAAAADRAHGSAPPQAPPAGGPDQDKEAFPPIHTPTAFRQRGELIADQPIESGAGDLAVLASERAGHAGGPPIYILILAFLLSAGVGLGVTVLIGTLLG
jgi:hypothetical protein